jgi:hypothetical protein
MSGATFPFYLETAIVDDTECVELARDFTKRRGPVKQLSQWPVRDDRVGAKTREIGGIFRATEGGTKFDDPRVVGLRDAVAAP